MMKKVLTLLLGLFVASVGLAEDEFQLIDQETNDVVYDRYSGKLYFSIPDGAATLPNSILPVDPITGTLGTPIPVGKEPNTLVLSDDGQYLYVALDGEGAIERISLATQTPDLRFTLSSDPSQKFVTRDMEALPGQPGSIAVVRLFINSEGNSTNNGVAIYDNGIERPVNTLTEKFPISEIPLIRSIEFSEDSTVLYGVMSSSPAKFYIMSVDASGVRVTKKIEDKVEATYDTEMKYENGLLYFSTGQIFDPKSGEAVKWFQSQYANYPFVPVPAANRVFFLRWTWFPEDWHLVAHDLKLGKEIESIVIPWSGDRLIQWGTDGFAFAGSTKFLLIRTSMLALPGPVDPPVVAGDADGSGTVDVRDAVLVLRSIVGLETLGVGGETRADLNGDGVVTVEDVVLILRKSIQL